MTLQGLSKNTREKLSLMPLNKEFSNELSKDTKYKLNEDGTLTLKNKLVMKAGEHNEVHYTWEELKAGYMTGEGAGLFYDHEDSVQNYGGLIKNLRLNEETKEIYGDVHVTNKQKALDISLGAKFGISPTIDAEKLLKDGKKYASDPNFLSYSLVLRPAVRETMLNSQKKAITEEKKLEGKERELQELAANVKKKDTRIQELENEAEESKKKIEESDKKIAEAEKKVSDEESEKLCALECSIGFTTEAEKNSRLEELKSLSTDVRANLKSTHEKYVKTLKLNEGEEDNGEAAAEELKESFLVFRKKYMEDNPKATDADVKAAFAKIPNDEDKDLNEDLNAKDPQVRMKAELSAASTNQNKVNSGILSYMKEQERK